MNKPAEPNSFRIGPDDEGMYGIFGGRFVAETLMPLILDLEKHWNEAKNDPAFRAELELPEGTYVVELDRFEQFSPCQDGGIAAFLYEHGNAGCGDGIDAGAGQQGKPGLLRAGADRAGGGVRRHAGRADGRSPGG